ALLRRNGIAGSERAVRQSGPLRLPVLRLHALYRREIPEALESHDSPVAPEPKDDAQSLRWRAGEPLVPDSEGKAPSAPPPGVTTLWPVACIVVKLGSSLVADEGGEVRADVLARICDEVADLHHGGRAIVVVTSGAIAR